MNYSKTNHSKTYLNAIVVIVTFIIATLTSTTYADYLIVERPAKFKEEPKGDGRLLFRPEIGSRLDLLQDNKVKGYYFAEHPQTGQRRYIYKTLVSRHRDTADLGALISGLSFPTHSLDASFFEWSTPHVYFHFISVGQGDATLIEFPCGVILIDAGTGFPSDKEALTDYLDSFFSSRPHLESNVIDAVYITHNHKDHANRIVDVLKKYEVIRYFDNGETSKEYQKKARSYISSQSPQTLARAIMDEDVVATRVGLTDSEIDPLVCDNCDPVITILSGGFDETSHLWSEVNDNPNDRSLVNRIDFGETSAIFSGDLQTGMIDILTDFYDDLLDVDIYQVGHHGADNGTTPEFVQYLTPEIAVFSMGNPGNRGSSHYGYGHPRISVLKKLRAYMSDLRSPSVSKTAFEKGKKPKDVLITRRIYATGWEGNIVVKGDLEGHIDVATSGP